MLNTSLQRSMIGVEPALCLDKGIMTNARALDAHMLQVSTWCSCPSSSGEQKCTAPDPCMAQNGTSLEHTGQGMDTPT